MKSKIIILVGISIAISSNSFAGLAYLKTPGTGSNLASISITASEVIEFYGSGNGNATGCTLSMADGSGAYVIKTIEGGVDQIGSVHGLAFPGPATFTLSGNNLTVKGFVSYRIVPASNYAMREPSNSKFMASFRATPSINPTIASARTFGEALAAR